jgi:hypothetical protein
LGRFCELSLHFVGQLRIWWLIADWVDEAEVPYFSLPTFRKNPDESPDTATGEEYPMAILILHIEWISSICEWISSICEWILPIGERIYRSDGLFRRQIISSRRIFDADAPDNP